MSYGSRFASVTGIPAAAAGPEPGASVVRKGLASWAGDETVMTVQVSSADHEIVEGYFTLGDNATVMVKPGSDLYKFLSRQRGRKVKITLTEERTPELSRLQR
jgi:hypothetical protein